MKFYVIIIFFLIFLQLFCGNKQQEKTNQVVNSKINIEFLKQEKEKYEKIIYSLTAKNLEIISKEKIIYEKNIESFNPDYRTNNSENYQYYPYIKYNISSELFHIAFSCIVPERNKSFFIVIGEKNNSYFLVFIKEFLNKEFFVSEYNENGRKYIQIQFENNTDYSDLYFWNNKTYEKKY